MRTIALPLAQNWEKGAQVLSIKKRALAVPYLAIQNYRLIGVKTIALLGQRNVYLFGSEMAQTIRSVLAF